MRRSERSGAADIPSGIARGLRGLHAAISSCLSTTSYDLIREDRGSTLTPMFARLTHNSNPQEHTALRRDPSRNIALANSNAESQLALRPLIVQTKLSVSQPNDHYEREADRIADTVMGASASSLSAATRNQNSKTDLFPTSSISPDSIQRKCDSCEEEEDLVQRKANHSGHDAYTPAPSIVRDVLQSPGQRLNSATLGFMQSRMGHDFSRVRVHSDSLAATAAEALQARAFTVGHDIAFASGAFAPESHEGRRLIAHELAHVTQQSIAGGNTQVIHRKHALDGRSTSDKVHEDIAPDVDAALAESKTITKFIAVKSLKKTKGNLSIEDPEVYKTHYEKYKKKHPKAPDVKDVPGFTDRDTGKIEMRLGATVEAALHEGIHLNSAAQFQTDFGHACNEGVTQFFTNAVLTEQGLSVGVAYPKELAMAQDLISLLTEDMVGKAYFKGDRAAFAAVTKAISDSKGTVKYMAWKDLMNSDKPPDWVTGINQLKTLFGK